MKPHPLAVHKPGVRRGTTSDTSNVGRRRALFAALVISTIAAALSLMLSTLSPGGLGWLELALTACFLVTLPWTVVGFWNAVAGLIIMRMSTDPAKLVFPGAASLNDRSPITTSTAILMCIRNEDAHKVSRNVGLLIEGLVNAGVSNRFHAYILSDTNSEAIAKNEKALFDDLQSRWHGIIPVTYRRRDNNAAYKAGNIKDFCERWGDRHDYALVLDADSLMSAPTVLRMVRTMQKNTRLGILQSLVVGMPTTSPFARAFQFGMRLGMRSYTLGSAWWQADCGPYWGHNALIRLRPFIEHCELPILPGDGPLAGWILSHDQFEAVLMRRAGYEVRVLPDEGGSWEENPPTLLEHIRRDLRWCHGNMQYLRLLGTPGLRPVSRIQLLLAVLMFIGSPAWIALMTLGGLHVGLADDASRAFDAQSGVILFASVMTMVFAPKLATVVYVLGAAKDRRAFGGSARLALSAFSEVLFSTLVAPVVALAHSLFLLGLPLGRTASWPSQIRSTHGLSIRESLARLWPQTLFGIALAAWLLFTSASALVGLLPSILGALLAIPIAVVSSREYFGVLMAGWGLWRIPDETAPASELLALRLPAASRSRPLLATSKTAFGNASGG